MNDEKLFDLCRQIRQETDPKRLAALTEELSQLLAEEQNEIKQKIAANLSRSAGN